MTNQSSIAISKYVLINICAKFLFISQHVIRYVSQLIAEEFWTQGDIERQELNVEPQPMFDRSVALSTVQIGNIIDFKKNTHMVYNSKSQDKVAQKIIPYLYRFLGFMHTPV